MPAVGPAMGLCLPCMGGAVKDVVETPDPVSAARPLPPGTARPDEAPRPWAWPRRLCPSPPRASFCPGKGRKVPWTQHGGLPAAARGQV